MTSAYPEESARRAFPAGTVAGFLQKPYTMDALVEQVDEVLKSGAEPSTRAGNG